MVSYINKSKINNYYQLRESNFLVNNIL
ncbi:hypothetical protein FOXB_03476 [Fusarium oxysporum f. sp. conglutinans Fo5176]|uniref:Uncharacterized protein n=1 Tax=Fusarium oxysporum (strain Fo5176) TaxID=660025 RepID=F9FAQ0_FUSOF|nr:hypothetical protein FOXB_03476 [Fusarium oxysporum f. sp. conglutinans Fo5176]